MYYVVRQNRKGRFYWVAYEDIGFGNSDFRAIGDVRGLPTEAQACAMATRVGGGSWTYRGLQ